MKVLSNILLLAGLAALMGLPLFVGHALSNHKTGWVLAGLGAAAGGAALLVVQGMIERRIGPPR